MEPKIVKPISKEFVSVWFILSVLIMPNLNLSASHFMVNLPYEMIATFRVPGDSRSTVTISMKTAGDRLSFLSVTCDRVEIKIPVRELTSIVMPNLGSVQLRYDSEDRRNMYIYLEYRSLTTPHTIMFHFEGKKYKGKSEPN